MYSLCLYGISAEPKANTGDNPGNVGPSNGSSGGIAPMGPSLSGLFAGGFPTLRPIGQRDAAGKTRGWCNMTYPYQTDAFSAVTCSNSDHQMDSCVYVRLCV